MLKNNIFQYLLKIEKKKFSVGKCCYNNLKAVERRINKKLTNLIELHIKKKKVITATTKPKDKKQKPIIKTTVQKMFAENHCTEGMKFSVKDFFSNQGFS